MYFTLYSKITPILLNSLTIRLKILVLILFIAGKTYCQVVSFSNLNTTNGLSDNFIQAMTIDKNGFLWIGTNEGLNSYDGYSVTNYPLKNYPGIPHKQVYNLFCDNQNIIWLGGPEGGAYADEKRNFHRILLDDSIKIYNCWRTVEIKKYGTVIITDKGQYYGGKANGHWKKITWLPKEMLPFVNTIEVAGFDDNKLLVLMTDKLLLIDYVLEKIIYQHPVKKPLSVCHIEGNKVAVADDAGRLSIMDITTGEIIQQYDFSAYYTPNINFTTWVQVTTGSDGNLYYASQAHGFFIIDKNQKVTHYVHDPADPHSIASDRVLLAIEAPNGNVVVGTERSGVSVFNIKKKQAYYQRAFADNNGRLFDSWLTHFAEDKDGSFWIGSFDRLIHWDKKNNKSSFYYYKGPLDGTVPGKPEIYRLHIDRSGQFWTGVLGAGVALFNKQTGNFNTIPRDLRDTAQQSSWVMDFLETEDGKLWVATQSGFFYIDTKTKKNHSFSGDSLLKQYCNTWTQSIIEDNNRNIWISTTTKGLICYNPVQKTIRQYTVRDGLLDNKCLELLCSRTNDIYVCSFKGFSIVHPDGTISSYTKENGLLFDKTDDFLEDNDGNIWIANAKCLAKFNPNTKKIEIFDEHVNLNNGGFKPNGGFKTSDGEFLWATQSGINYFYPSAIANTTDPIQLSIYNVLVGDSSYAITGKTTRLTYNKNNVEFNFVAINLSGSKGINYQYKLEGYDQGWQQGTDIRQARYSFLPPGHYTFKVRASLSKINWTESSNIFSFTIIAPFYMRWWFKPLIALGVIGLLVYLYQKRNKQFKEKREELETEQAINYFASSMYQQQTVDEILWDVAKNCIGRLQFEDCVIYLLDEQKNVLVQKAAHGPKSPRSFEIEKPIDIPLGKGIVGSVAESMKAEIISDTSKDSRYIADDAIRLSEISVPIVSDGRLLGVIDCEHSKKRFFTQKHLSILSTIASLCANKITRTRAEAEKRNAETMLTETKQKMAEAEMQALRAQMNPHFIFNCLNSINRYIVKSDQATASLYLTRFAKLIRLILDNSHSKNVVLSNELESLRLYIEMESLRFDNKFTYEIKVDKQVSADTIEVPPLIIQPYIENAIWHGLLHKPAAGNLNIYISQPLPNMLQCIIEDNGIGRGKAAELKSKSATKKKSLGMELTENRLLLLNQYASVHSSVQIEDLKNGNGEATGTRVILQIPVGDN